MSFTNPNGPAWAHADSVPPVGYASRKALPIKRNDAESLTREDVQYDLLNYIFSDSCVAFTPQIPGKTGKVTFRDLYVNALYNSAKCSKVLKDKMVETPAFALEFAKICLLTNVGRINTTMAFFPEMKTALRTYHPVPSLQKTDGNAQDAPRIKNCLKAALLPTEIKTVPPSTPDEILAKLREGRRPPTSVVNLIFVLSNHAAPLARVHWDGSMNFLDFFLPKPLSSADRSRCFLWFMHHYLEGPDVPNPFGDDFSRMHPDHAPRIRQLSPREAARENVDTEDEIVWGNQMSYQRNLFLRKLVSSMDGDKKGKATPHFVPVAAEPSTSTAAPRQPRGEKDETPFMFYVPGRDPVREHTPGQMGDHEMGDVTMGPLPHLRPVEGTRGHFEPRKDYPIQPAEPLQYQRQPMPLPNHMRQHSDQGRMSYRGMPARPPPPPLPHKRFEDGRTMMQQSWLAGIDSDPLADSDEERNDNHLLLDYKLRLEVLTRIRGRSPTPDSSLPERQFYTARIP